MGIRIEDLESLDFSGVADDAALARIEPWRAQVRLEEYYDAAR